MNKNRELLKHRNIKKIGISQTGGMIIIFSDKSHTYIDPDNIKNWISNFNKLLKEGKIIYEEE